MRGSLAQCALEEEELVFEGVYFLEIGLSLALREAVDKVEQHSKIVNTLGNTGGQYV